jgi:hypothetical protein
VDETTLFRDVLVLVFSSFFLLIRNKGYIVTKIRKKQRALGTCFLLQLLHGLEVGSCLYKKLKEFDYPLTLFT